MEFTRLFRGKPLVTLLTAGMNSGFHRSARICTTCATPDAGVEPRFVTCLIELLLRFVLFTVTAVERSARVFRRRRERLRDDPRSRAAPASREPAWRRPRQATCREHGQPPACWPQLKESRDATRAARAIAASRSSSGACTWVTRPQDSAVRASYGEPVSSMALARETPISRGSR